MNKKVLFTGAATALITPFKNGKVDLGAFEKIIDYQIEGGVDALVVCGTTGEVSTLCGAEKEELIQFTVTKAKGKVPVIAGVGGNNTDAACKMAKKAQELGADGVLSVAPYYNKGTKSGIVEHYRRIAESAAIPLIVYNVPTRTGVNIDSEMNAKMSRLPYICGVKESCGNMEQCLKIVAETEYGYTLYSGNDSDTLPIMSLGGAGVISVASNIIPHSVSRMCHSFLEGRLNEAKNICLSHTQLFTSLFCEVNPVPIKYAMYRLGFCRNELRLPLTQASPETQKNIDAVLEKLGFV